MYALEIETPYKKRDLVRFQDNYGRQKKEYEGKSFTKNLDSKFLKFKNPKQGKQNIYKFSNVVITIESKKNFKSFKKRDDKSTSAILKGSLVDKKGQNVISYGEIIKTSTLRILSDKFIIKKPLTILRVSKR